MKQIQVLTFGAIKDIIGSSRFTMEDVGSTRELASHLEAKHPLLKTIQYAIAVDMQVVHENTTLEHNATVAILPPFSGG